MVDKVYSLNNEYFLFEFTQKEFVNKIFIAVLLISVIPSKKIRLGIYFTLLLVSFFQLVHFEYFGKNISAIEFYLFATNVGETFETLKTMINMIYIPLIIILFAFMIIYIVELIFGNKVFKFKYGLHIIMIILLFISSKVFYMTNIKTSKLTDRQSKYLYPTVNRLSSRNFYVSLNYFLLGVIPKKVFNNESKYKTLKKPLLLKSNLNRTVILIIGESLRYDTFALDNNKLTPKLQSLKEDNKFHFKKVYAGGTMTKVSVSVLINRLKHPEGLMQINNEDNCLFKLAKENNIDTNFISAQHSKHLPMIRDMICPKYIDSLITRSDFSKYITEGGYDDDLKTVLNERDILNKDN